MKTIQMLEICAGVATSLIVFLCFCLFVGFIHNREPRPTDADSFANILLLVWTCSLMVAFGAYFDVVKRSNIALAALFIGGSIVIIIFGFFSFIMFAWWGLLFSLIFGFLVYSPVILSAITIVLAIKSRMRTNF